MSYEVPVTAEHAVAVLNRMLTADPDAVEDLVAYRVPCNATLADDETVQVDCIVRRGEPVPGTERVGLLGVLNGIFGLQPGLTCGWIAAEVAADRRTIRRFTIFDTQPSPPPAAG